METKCMYCNEDNDESVIARPLISTMCRFGDLAAFLECRVVEKYHDDPPYIKASFSGKRGELIASGVSKIHFCPVCGRNLDAVEEEV